MVAVLAPAALIQSCPPWATNSGPVSERLWAGTPVRHEQAGEHVDDLGGLELASDADGQARVGELVDDIEPPDLAPVLHAILLTVVSPDLVAALRPEPDTGAVVGPEPSLLGVPSWHLQPLAPPDPLDPLRAHEPTRSPQQSGDLAAAMAPGLACEREDVRRQSGLIVPPPRHLAPVSSGADHGRNRRRARRGPLQLDALATGARARRGSGAPPVQGGTSPPDRVRHALPSPGGLRQEALVRREIRASLAEPLVIELQLLEPAHLVRLQPALLLTPA